MPDSAIKNILVIKLGALGDFIQALGPMAAIRKHHPDAEITLLTTEPFITLARECGYFDTIWTDEKPKLTQPAKWLKLKKKLTSAAFDRVYDLQNNDRTTFYFNLFPRKKRPQWVGSAKGASHRNNSPERTAGHAFDGHVQTLELAGIKDVSIDKLDWIKTDIDHFHLSAPYVLIVPGCAPTRPEKRWPAEHYAALARIIHNWGYQPVIIGTKAESEIAKDICSGIPQCADLTGRTSLTDLAALSRGAAAAIGNDTGPMHIIAPTGCPSYVIFSDSSDPIRHAPQGDNVRVIKGGNLQKSNKEEILEKIKSRDFRNE